MKFYIGLKEKVTPTIFESDKDPARKRILNTILSMDPLEVRKTLRNTLKLWALELPAAKVS